MVCYRVRTAAIRFALLLAASVPAAEAWARPSFSVEIGGGLVGFEASANVRLNRFIGLRGGTTILSPAAVFDPILTEPTRNALLNTLCNGGACTTGVLGNPNTTVNFESFNAFLDIYPLGGGFRLTGGVLIGLKVGGSFFMPTSQAENLGEKISFGDHLITAGLVNTVQTEVDIGEYTPYFGIGWIRNLGRGSVFGAFVNVGAMVVIDPQVRVSAGVNLGSFSPFTIDELEAAEAERVRRQITYSPLVPYISIGVTMRLF